MKPPDKVFIYHFVAHKPAKLRVDLIGVGTVTKYRFGKVYRNIESFWDSLYFDIYALYHI
jgi:hypothetical protein